MLGENLNNATALAENDHNKIRIHQMPSHASLHEVPCDPPAHCAMQFKLRKKTKGMPREQERENPRKQDAVMTPLITPKKKKRYRGRETSETPEIRDCGYSYLLQLAGGASGSPSRSLCTITLWLQMSMNISNFSIILSFSTNFAFKSSISVCLSSSIFFISSRALASSRRRSDLIRSSEVCGGFV